jgi:hypothetical protein
MWFTRLPLSRPRNGRRPASPRHRKERRTRPGVSNQFVLTARKGGRAFRSTFSAV